MTSREPFFTVQRYKNRVELRGRDGSLKLLTPDHARRLADALVMAVAAIDVDLPPPLPAQATPNPDAALLNVVTPPMANLARAVFVFVDPDYVAEAPTIRISAEEAVALLKAWQGPPPRGRLDQHRHLLIHPARS